MKKMIISAATQYDIPWIIDTQITNHGSYLTAQEKEESGFVSVLTPSLFLNKINHNKKILIARLAEGEYQGKPIGYLITCNENDAQDHPFFKKVFSDFIKKDFDAHRCLFIVQIAKITELRSRTKGVGTALYEHLFESVIPFTAHRYVFTEVSPKNPVSVKLHERLGFEEVKRYKDVFDNQMILLMKEVNKKA